MAIFTAGVFGVDIDALDVGSLIGSAAGSPTATSFTISAGGAFARFFGTGFQYGAVGVPSSGTIERLVVELQGQTLYDLQGVSVGANAFFDWVSTGANTLARATLLAGADTMTGSGLGDRLRGFAGDDTIAGAAGGDYLDGGDGDDDVFGGLGDDTVVDGGGANYLRGDEGNDYVLGAAAFDDINGNMGNDTCQG